MLKRGLPWLLVAAALGTVGAAAEPTPSDQAQFNYAHGFDATGDFAGTCIVNGVRFSSAAHQVLRFETGAATLVVRRAFVNQTVLYSPIGQGLGQFDRLEETVYDLTPGTITVTAPAGSHAALINSLYGYDEGAMHASFAGSQWRAPPAEANFPSAMQFDHYYWEMRPEGPFNFPQMIAGPAFLLSTDAASFPVSGHGFLQTDETTIEAGAFRLTLPPFRQTLEATETPVGAHRKVVETYAILKLDGFQATLDPVMAEPACGSLRWQGDGVVTFRTAAGWVARQEDRRDFDRRELTLQGSLDSSTVAFWPNQNGPVYTQGAAAGRFEAVGLDFEPLSLGSSPAIPFKELGLWAVVVAAAGAVAASASRFVAFFYTRVGPQKALEHPVRSLLFGAAHDKPGFILKDIVQATGRPYAVVRHHAYILAHLGLIRTLRWGRALHVYPKDASLRTARRNLVWEKNAGVRFAVKSVGATGKSMVMAGRELRATFGLSRMGAWKVLRRAETTGFLRREKRAEGVWLCAQE